MNGEEVIPTRSPELEAARRVQEFLIEQYGNRPDFLGFGLVPGSKDGSYAVEVLMATKAASSELPASIEGVELRNKVTGRIKAL